MKKRMLCIAVAMVMMLSSFACVSAHEYDGIKQLQTAERLINQLNADAGEAIFDGVGQEHEDQLDALKTANNQFATRTGTADWTAYIDKIYTGNTSKDEKIWYYMLALEIADSDNAFATELAAIDNDPDYNTSSDATLAVSFDKLQDYREVMATFLTSKGTQIRAFESTLSDAQKTELVKKYVLMATLPVYQAIFSDKGTGEDNAHHMYYNYEQWLQDDHAKKLFAMLLGDDLTKELAGVDGGFMGKLMTYMQTSNGLRYVKQQLNDVFHVNKEDAVTGMYDFLGSVLCKAYEGVNDEVLPDIKMFFGDGTDVGAFELAMRAIDTDKAVANVWLNLFLSHYTQATLPTEIFNTISASTSSPGRVTLYDNTSINFVVENLFSEYGITDPVVQSNLALNNSWFNIKCYYEDRTPNNNVTFDGKKIQITKDEGKGENYNAFLILYRDDAGVDSFIESYPVTIINKTIPTGGGGGVTRYTITYETNGGSEIAPELVVAGRTVELTKKPEKAGYIFSGWYLDEALTQPVTSVVVDRNIKVYAGWVKDGSTVVSKVPVPEMLNGDDHYAYIMGYPDETIRPQGNITRAETVTIIFRLLEDEVRNANITDENVFADVNDGDWFNTAVSTLASLGIVEGRTKTEFMPNEYITRAEFSTIVARFAEYDYETAEAFTDVAGHWAKDYIYEAAAYGWIAGYEDNTFRPDKFITRAEAMTLTNRVLKRVPENTEDLLEGMNEWSDNMDTSAWYYIAVQEATNSHEYTRKNDANETWTKLTEGRDWTQYEK